MLFCHQICLNILFAFEKTNNFHAPKKANWFTANNMCVFVGFASSLDIGLSNWGLEFVTISL